MTTRFLLKAYELYCSFWYPLYKTIKIDSFSITISDTSIVPPVLFSRTLLHGELKGKRILDVGTGCGIIALLAKQKRADYVLGVDINNVAISNAEINLKNNFTESRSIEFKQSDLYKDVIGRFDIIVSNPPFLKMKPLSKNEYKFCGGDMLEKLLREGKDYLTPQGEIRILHPRSAISQLENLSSRYDYVMQKMDYIPSRETSWLRFLLRLSISSKLNLYVFRVRDPGGSTGG